MGERTSHAPGTFSWVDLATTDQDAAKAFYSGLFGWEADDMPAGEGVIYSMMRIGDRHVAAIAPQPEQQTQAGIPPMWQSYVTVQSADEAAARAGELGAHVHAGPFDVFDSGRMAVIQDPQGAFFMIWEPKSHIGAGLVNAHGALCWNELATSDADASAAFYGDLFGWKVEQAEGSQMPYWMIKTAAERMNGGFRLPGPGEPPNWVPYFATDDLDDSLAKVQELGGSKLMGPMQIAEGVNVAIVKDPQGAVFVLYNGPLED